MKKKIKDLTDEECQKICDKYHNCDICPLYGIAACLTIGIHIPLKFVSAEDLEREVEVDE